MSEPAPSIGHNNPPIAETLAADYRELLAEVVDISFAASNAPREVASEDDVNAIVVVIKKSRDVSKRLDSARSDAKKPFLDAGRAVDDFFRKPANDCDAVVKPLTARVDAYRRKLEEADRIERARQADEHRQRTAELLQAAADTGNSVVQEALVQSATSANASFEQARGEALTTNKAAPIRTDAGSVGVRKTLDFVLDDPFKALSSPYLHPFIDRASIESAIRRFIATNRDSIALPGVRIFETTKTVVR